MEYFLDTQFHEYYKKPLFGKSAHTIEPISIGIVSGDVIQSYTLYYDGSKPENIGDTWDRRTSTNFEELQEEAVLRNEKQIGWIVQANKKSSEYYAICNEFDLEEAWSNVWLKDNILIPITEELSERELALRKEIASDNLNLQSSRFTIWIGKPTFKDFKRLIMKYGKTKARIAIEIKDFCASTNDGIPCFSVPKFYGYYSSYDWVVICQLYGKLDYLPKGFPMYCNDLKQTLEEKWSPFQDNYRSLEGHPDSSKKESSHNSINNAKWNKHLYEFLNRLK